MMKLDIKIDSRVIERELAAMPSQIKFATALALTATAKTAVADIQATMKKVFDRPTTFTLGAFYAKPAKKTDLSAWVGSREFAGKGRPASKYLSPEILGGARVLKGFERALAAVSGGQYAMPGKDAKLDAFGNMQRGQLVLILSRLSLLLDQNAKITEKTTARLRRKGLLTRASGMRSDIFVARDRGGRAKGIYQLVSRGKVAQLLVFVSKAPKYKAVLPFDMIVTRSITVSWPKNAQAAIGRAIATANKP